MTKLRRIQFATVTLHSLVLLLLTCWFVFVSSPYDHMAGFAWFAILGWIDLPATAALILSWNVLPDSFLHMFWESDIRHPFGSISNFWLPLLFYGTIGTWFWWKVPAMIAGLVNFAKRLIGPRREPPPVG